MEAVLHYMYVVAIKDRKAWLGDSPAEIAMIGFWNLIVVWLKLLIPWRFFRAWALFDGIDPPENMVRCMVNNYSTFGFWRSWHRSYNLWIIRYVTFPFTLSKVTNCEQIYLHSTWRSEEHITQYAPSILLCCVVARLDIPPPCLGLAYQPVCRPRNDCVIPATSIQGITQFALFPGYAF
jgi:hypothetical protein